MLCVHCFSPLCVVSHLVSAQSKVPAAVGWVRETCHPTSIAGCIGLVTDMYCWVREIVTRHVLLGVSGLSPTCFRWVRETCHPTCITGCVRLVTNMYCWVRETCHPTRIAGCVRLVTRHVLLGARDLPPDMYLLGE